MNTSIPLTPARRDFLASIIVTAIEGGTGYWAECRSYTHQGGHDGLSLLDASAEIIDNDREHPAVWTPLTVDLVEATLAKLQEGTVEEAAERFKIAPHYLRDIREADDRSEGGIIDADLADCIVQVAINGEVIFG